MQDPENAHARDGLGCGAIQSNGELNVASQTGHRRHAEGMHTDRAVGEIGGRRHTVTRNGGRPNAGVG
jgi:hypothetical protein